MTSIASLADPVPPVLSEAKVFEIDARFEQAPRAVALAVCRDGRVVGVLERTAVQKAMRAGFDQSAIDALMLSEPLIVEADTPARTVCRALLANRDVRRDIFVAVKDGVYQGVGTLEGLVDQLLSADSGAESLELAVRAVEEAEQAAEHKRRIVEVIDQEFRTPLNGILAMAQMLRRQPMGADALTQVESIYASGDALLRLLSDSMDLTRAQQGVLELDVEPVLLRTLADSLQDSWNRPARQAGVDLLVSYDGDPELQAELDPGRVKQIFDNLIASALTYTRSGAIEASLKARREDGDVVLEGRVRDTGPGLAPARLARIFDPVDTDREARGTGLTLSLTRELIECMRGAIRAESNIGQGMTIVFDLIAPLAAPPPSATIEPRSSPTHVLVVDDNATNRMVAEALCEMFDCTSECAHDGVEAVEAARSGRFDLILMDIKMPRMDGLEAARAIRALGEPVGDTPIVALTANVDAEDARTYLAAGMCCVVEKPIKPDRLLYAINIALDSRSLPADSVQAA
jgi:signal transduction histidine kinase/CheY-like chemotaxis protein